MVVTPGSAPNDVRLRDFCGDVTEAKRLCRCLTPDRPVAGGPKESVDLQGLRADVTKPQPLLRGLTPKLAEAIAAILEDR
jgi:hypothetical protein